MRDLRRGIRYGIGGVLAALVVAGPARADVVNDWSRIAVEVIQSEQQRPAVAAQDLATAHIALFEAMNYVEGKYAPRYLVRPPTPSVSSEAAGAAAVHEVLSGLYPARKDQLDAQLRGTLLMIAGTDHSAAALTGSQLGRIVKVARDAERPADENAARAGVGAVDSIREALAWSAKVARAAEDRQLEPLEVARLYARAAIAVSETYANTAGSAVESAVGTSLLVGQAINALLLADLTGNVSGIDVASLQAAAVSTSRLPQAGEPAAGTVRNAMRHYRRIE
jgi:hypothetical protein